MASANLSAAKKAKKDEFYTQYADIAREMEAYLDDDANAFRGKTVLLPCDDPEWSNFTRYFAENFGRIDLADLKWDYLDGDGDFRSDEVKALRDEADIIVTKPPFSLFREFLAWILAAKNAKMGGPGLLASAAKSEDGNGGGVLAAKNAKVAKIGGRGLSAFALSAFSAAKNGDGMAAKDAKVAKTWGRGWSAFALSAFFAAKNGDGMVAKDAKVAKTGGRGLSAFALSAFSVAKNRDENAEMAEKMGLGEEK